MGKTKRQPKNCQREESQIKRLQRKYDEAKHEIKRLRNIIKRTNPERLREMLESEQRKHDNNQEVSKQQKPERGPRCPKCQGFKLTPITFTRPDGTFTITICKADHCGHRSPPVKVVETESISTHENNDNVMEEQDGD